MFEESANFLAYVFDVGSQMEWSVGEFIAEVKWAINFSHDVWDSNFESVLYKPHDMKYMIYNIV